MNQIILVSHGGLAAGARDTLSMVLGQTDNVHVVSLARDDKEPISRKVEVLIASFGSDDAVYILTDMLGSSVNNAMVELMRRNPRITVISGMNMPLILGLATVSNPVRGPALADLIRESRSNIRDCGATARTGYVAKKKTSLQQKEKAAASGHPAKISLVRLDYRLLHGQVVFAWVNTMGAQRIICVDDEAATDEVRKGALKLAKPSGVRLNIFTVEHALSKMAKLETLGENVMMIFGKTHELLEFCKSYPKIKEINYGATSNKAGAKRYGGSVFLDASERKDTEKLLALGLKIYVQQTPTLSRENLTSVS